MDPRDHRWHRVLGPGGAPATLERRRRAVQAAWDGGDVPRADVHDLHFDAAVFDGIEETLALLDAPWRDALFARLERWALADPAERPLTIFGGIHSYEHEPDPEEAGRQKREVDDRQAASEAYFMNVVRPRIGAWWAARQREGS